MDQTWLYHYDPETKQNQWSDGIAAHPVPNVSECKNPWEISRLDFFGIKTASSSSIIFQRAKVSTRSIVIPAGAIEGHFEGKTWRECHQGVLFLHDNPPAHGAFASQKKLTYMGFQCLDHPPNSPDLAPSGYHLFPGLKNNCKLAIFRPMQRSLFPRRPGWKDKLLIFLSGLQKEEQRAKKFIELRGEYLE